MGSWKLEAASQTQCILLQYHWQWGKAAHVGWGWGVYASLCERVLNLCSVEAKGSCRVLPYTFHLILLRVSPGIQK